MTCLVSKSLVFNRLESLGPFGVLNIFQTEQKIVCDSINQIFVLLGMRKSCDGEAGAISGYKDGFMFGDRRKKALRTEVNCCSC